MKYNLIQPNKLRIGESSVKGRGVFANEDIENGEVVEECHFVIPERSKGGADKEMLRYMFACIYTEDREKHELLSSKFFLHQMIDDDQVKKDLEEQLKEMGYNDISELFSAAFVLGLGMVYNHSADPNIDYIFDHGDLLFRYTANKNIKSNEELFIDYGNSEREDLN
jgi:SET domain-containing protein